MTEFFDPPDADLADDIFIRLETGETISLLEFKDRQKIVERGGPGSGHHGHEGRPGEVGGSLPSDEILENRPEPTGQCFECAAKWIMDEGEALGDDVRLVHGTVAGQGPLEGIRFVHAWVEFGDMVYDADKEALMRRERYYELGKIRDTIEYDPTEMRVNLLKHEHWGPWHEKFDDGPWVEKRAPLDIRWIEKGGPGSGYHAPHFGRPGVRGGSRPRHEGMGLTKESVDNISIYTSKTKTAGIIKEAMELMQAELGITLPKMVVTDNNEWFAARERKYLNKYRELVDERLDQYEKAMRNLMLDAPGTPEEINPLQHEMEDFHVGRWRYLAELNNQELLDELNRSVGGSYGKGKGIVWLNSETLASPGSKGFNYTLWHEVGHAINHEVSGEEFNFLIKGYRGFGRDRNGVPWKYSDRVGPRGAYERRNSLGYERDRVPDEYFADLTAAYMGNALYSHGYKLGRRFGWRSLDDRELADMNRVIAHIQGEETPLTERVLSGEGDNVIVYYPQGDGTYEGLERTPEELENLSPQALRSDDLDDMIKMMGYPAFPLVLRGGPGSGHHGHRGRPGEVGGSLPSGAVAVKKPAGTAIKDFRLEVTDVYEGQMNGSLTALDEDGDMIGMLEWIEFRDEVSIESFVSENVSRRGEVYKALREQLKEEFPDAWVKVFDIGVEEIGEDEAAELEPLPEIEYIPFDDERNIQEMARNERLEGRFVYPTIDPENERYVMIRSLDPALEWEADKIRHEANEHFAAFTEKEGREFWKEGDSSSVRFSLLDMDTMQGHAERMRARNLRFITMHNHPADDRYGLGFPPSLSDFQSAIQSGASEFRVIVPDGEYRVRVLQDYNKNAVEKLATDWRAWEDANVDGYIPDRPMDRSDRKAWLAKSSESEDFARRYAQFQIDRINDIENFSETFNDYFDISWRPLE